MKTLFLIRHAKSSWDDTALPDKDRPLSDRGKRDAPKMGKRLAKRDVMPNLILSSPARRALTTAEIIAKKLGYKRKDIVVDDRLYSSAVDDLLNVVQKLSDKLERVMLFGHNPELTEFAPRLSSEISHMPARSPSLSLVRSPGQILARPSSQKWRSIIQRNRPPKHRVGDEGDCCISLPTIGICGETMLRRKCLRLQASDEWRRRYPCVRRRLPGAVRQVLVLEGTLVFLAIRQWLNI
jgi:phosphohistidine phosphatase